MRATFLLFNLIILPLLTRAQNTAVQQKALKSITDYANNSAEEVTAVVQSIISYYPRMDSRSSFVVNYVSPVQLENYYYDQALKESPALANKNLENALKQLRLSSESLDSRSKALETYHKLEDYKKDNFEEAKKIVSDIIHLLDDYQKKQSELSSELGKIQQKIPPHSYGKASENMRSQIYRERMFLNLWKLNLNEEVHTGWITQQLEKSILETDEAIKQLEQLKPQLNYPASSMWPSFREGLQSILEIKRTALDEYNHNAKKSDKHSNDVYLSLINYFNGVLISDYNTFLGFASNDKFFSIPVIKYVPSIEIRAQKQAEEVKITPFQDVELKSPVIARQKTSIQKPVYKALNNYVGFINETYRQLRNESAILRNLNQSAAHYATLTTFAGRGGITFSHEDFEVPLAAYQKTIAESKILPADQTVVLNKQSEILLNILKEIDQIATVLERETSEKRYEKDHCAYIFQLLERTKILYDTWDFKKEQLFTLVRNIYDSFPASDAKNSWQVSGNELWQLTVLDRDGLFLAKKYYSTSEAVTIETSAIDQQLREIISKEFENMKGIQKYGRSNGLCPYTPYEDIPKDSKSLSEAFQQLKPAKEKQYGYQHPYYSMIYLYNDIVDDYNKFCELSPVLLLQSVKQPELFTLQYPGKEVEPSQQTVQTNQTPRTPAVAAVAIPKESPKPVEAKPTVVTPAVVLHDTVYIEKRDTVFLHDSNQDIRSMEGYAINNMVLLLDVSGSMNSKEKLPLLKQSVLQMLSMMRQEDKISILVFSGKPKVLLQNVSFTDESKIRKAINDLKPSGTTDGNAGIKLAYKVADQNYLRGGNNRIILATDGEFVIEEESKKLIESFSNQDIYLSVFNFSKGTGKSLQQLSTIGKGNYEVINAQNVDNKLISEAKAKRKR
jgi:Ca-activated chloride channel homolog